MGLKTWGNWQQAIVQDRAAVVDTCSYSLGLYRPPRDRPTYGEGSDRLPQDATAYFERSRNGKVLAPYYACPKKETSSGPPPTC